MMPPLVSRTPNLLRHAHCPLLTRRTDGRKVDVAERKDRNGNVVVVYNHHKPNPARDEPRASDF